MNVILLERIEKLGQMGDIVSVKPGFARNFLLPQGKALRATEANRSHFETQRAQLEAENLNRKQEAEAVAQKMADIKVVLIRQAGDAGQLYGSVSARDIADAVTEAGATIKRAQVILAQPIKTIGLHEVRVELHGEVIVTMAINVARSNDEAVTQEKTGAAVLSLAQQEEMTMQAEAQAAAAAAEAVVEQAEEIFDEGAAESAVAEAEAAAEDVQESDENVSPGEAEEQTAEAEAKDAGEEEKS